MSGLRLDRNVSILRIAKDTPKKYLDCLPYLVESTPFSGGIPFHHHIDAVLNRVAQNDQKFDGYDVVSSCVY